MNVYQVIDVLRRARYALALFCRPMPNFDWATLNSDINAAIEWLSTQAMNARTSSTADGGRAETEAQARLGAGAAKADAGSPD